MSDSRNLTLLTDLYELTMMQGYFKNHTNPTVVFDAFFRKNPFDSSYSIAAGLEQAIEYIRDLHFSQADVDYLRSTGLFDEDFLDYLLNFHFSGDIYAIPEGTVVFPREPLVKVVAPIMEAQLVETALLNIVNHQSLIATKASRVVYAAGGDGIMEFGLRRAQGPDAGLYGARAAMIGGCIGTSCVLTGQMFNVPVKGTHAHSWIMSFPDEYTAFKKYAELYPNACILLVDTYDTLGSGVPNAIRVFNEMKAAGIKSKFYGIRLDSGDLAWLSRYARERLDAAGLTDCGIVLSNDLDEYTIESIREQGANVMSWGVGTKLATAYDQPALGGVYKLSATKSPSESKWKARLKVTEMSSKLTLPGVIDVRRFFFDDGRIAGDMVFDVNEPVNAEDKIIDPSDLLRQKSLAGLASETLLRPLSRDGKSVLAAEDRCAMAAQARAKEALGKLDESQKRLLNPHTYPVGLEEGMWHRRAALVAELRGQKIGW